MSKLRVWWVSQMGTDAIHIPVQSVKEAKKTMDLLSYFDCFQYNQHIRPDYSNTGGLEMYDEETQEWCDWVYEDDNEYIEDIDEWCEKFLSKDEQEELKNYENTLRSQVRFD